MKQGLDYSKCIHGIRVDWLCGECEQNAERMKRDLVARIDALQAKEAPRWTLASNN